MNIHSLLRDLSGPRPLRRVIDLVSKPIIWERKATPFIPPSISSRTPERGQTRSQHPPSLIPTPSPCPPDTGIATQNVLDQWGNKDTHSSVIRQALCVISRCHLGNTDSVRADHTDRGISTVPSVRHGTTLRWCEDTLTQGVTFDEVVRSLPPTRNLRRSREPRL